MTHDDSRQLPEWATEATLGIFIHWGPYSVPAWAEPTGAWGAVPPERWFAHNAYAEWYANTVRIAGSPAAEHQKTVHDDAPYEAFLDSWTADAYEPDVWAELFASLGADYIIPVTKHHDGVTLWEAPGTPTLNTTSRGPQRDLLAPLAEAVRARGMRFGVYYSGGLDWAFTDFPPIQSMEDVENYRPTGPDYAAYATAHVRDLIDRYQPSVIWNDIDWPDAGKRDGSLSDLLAHYRTVVPDGIVNDRWGADVGDYRTSEYSHGTDNERGVGWEHNRGLGFSFGFNQIEDTELTLTPRALARLYADVVSRGGRLLLNVGPDASGRIPDVQLNSLRGTAEWITAIKPHTLARRPLTESENALFITPQSGWNRGWVSGEHVVIVGEQASLIRDSHPAIDIAAFDLPD